MFVVISHCSQFLRDFSLCKLNLPLQDTHLLAWTALTLALSACCGGWRSLDWVANLYGPSGGDARWALCTLCWLVSIVREGERTTSQSINPKLARILTHAFVIGQTKLWSTYNWTWGTRRAGRACGSSINRSIDPSEWVRDKCLRVSLVL